MNDQLGVDRVLVLLVVALEFVKLNEYDSLVLGEMLPERLADVRDEHDCDRGGLRGEGKVLRGDIFQTSRAHHPRQERLDTYRS